MRAKTKLGKFEYDPLNNNCEHFARWCKSDENVSVQAEVAKVGVAASSIGMAAIGLLLGQVVRRYLGI